MATLEYQYQSVSHESLLKVIKWAQNTLNLRDWEIGLDTGPEIPRVLMPGREDDYEGLARIHSHRLRALIWIPLDRLGPNNVNPIETCLHEMLHILVGGQGLDDDELLVRTISPLIYRVYCHDNKIKVAKLK